MPPFEAPTDGVATSRKLLGQFMVLGMFLDGVKRDSLVQPPKHGKRGAVRATRKRRRRVLHTTLARNAWRRHFEDIKRTGVKP